MPPLQDPPVRLEPQTATHAEEMFQVLGDPEIYRYENTPPASIEWLRARFLRLESGASPDGRERWLNWVIRTPSAALIGYVQATVYAASDHAAIAYVLHSRYWGQGLATAAVKMMVDELVARHGVRQLSAVLKMKNLKSRALLERMGFALSPQTARNEYVVEADELLMWKKVGRD